MPLNYRHDGPPLPSFDTPYQVVCHVNGVTPEMVGANPELMDWLGVHTTIVAQFERPHPADAAVTQMISPGRAASIPAITARWQELVRPARGQLSTYDIIYAWRTNMPANTGQRHPDALFDAAQMNFGSDEPLGHVMHTATWAQRERIAMAQQYRRAISALLVPLRFSGDIPEALVDSLIDNVRGHA
jgi:hypothetical protein